MLPFRVATTVIAAISSVIVTGLFVSYSAVIAVAGETPAEDKSVKTVLHADLAGQVNPEGLMLSAGAYRRWNGKMDAAFDMPSSYFQTGFGLSVSPAYAKAAMHAEWQPALFATFRLEYDVYRFFGQYGALLSMPSADSKFGKGDVQALEGREEKAWGQRTLFQPTLSAKAGPVIIRNQTDLAYYRFSGIGPYFLDWEYDTLLKDNDFVAANRTQFLVKAWQGTGAASLFAGPYYEITHAVRADINRQRVGGLLYWVPADKLGESDRPRVYSQFGMNVQDRNRNGELYLILGVGFDVDL